MTAHPFAFLPEHNRFLTIEITISCVINMVVNGLFVWLLFGGMAEIPLWTMQGLAFDLVPTTFMITFMMTLVLTLVTRFRVRKGSAPGFGWDRRDHPFWGKFPRAPYLRAPMLAFIMLLVLVPPQVLVLWALDLAPFSFTTVVIYKVFYGLVLSLIVTPLILIPALADKPRTSARETAAA